MKLASIINVWADCIELLPFCIKNHLEFCDAVIVIWSQHSNHGEKNDAVLEYILANGHDSRVEFHQLEPMRMLAPLANETRKRNHGLDIARKKGFTHFLISDSDEFYDPKAMNIHREEFKDETLNGFVHSLRVYIKEPTLWTDDHTLVAGIHCLMPNTTCGQFRFYPYAYDEQGNAHIDPSRRLNFYNGIEKSDSPMFHMSYVRKNIDLKIDNSSANLNRSRQVIYNELRDAKPGYLSRIYHQPLKESENFFNLPSW